MAPSLHNISDRIASTKIVHKTAMTQEPVIEQSHKPDADSPLNPGLATPVGGVPSPVLLRRAIFARS